MTYLSMTCSTSLLRLRGAAGLSVQKRDYRHVVLHGGAHGAVWGRQGGLGDDQQGGTGA